MEARLAVLAFAFLVLLAVLLWEPAGLDAATLADLDRCCEEARRHIAARDAVPVLATPPSRSRLPTYDGGRTTIPPKVTDAVLARIRGR